jgi:hypothetical protein
LHLQEHLALANDSDDGPNCRCRDCYWNGRFELANPQNRVLPGVNCRSCRGSRTRSWTLT